MDWTPPEGIDWLAVLGRYEGPLRDQILTLKRRRGTAAVPWMADQLSAEIARLVAQAEVAPVVTWLPTTRRRRAGRGFDQSRLLARAVARRSGLECRGLLRRHGAPQQGLGGEARRSGPLFSCLPSPPQVIVVDDVMTTGSSLQAAAAALRASGADAVSAVVLAVVPARDRMIG